MGQLQRILCVAAGLAAASCATCAITVNYTPVHAPAEPMAARAQHTVDLFTSSAPTRAHIDVALLEALAPWATTTTQELFSALRIRAAQAGCDAVVVKDITEDAAYRKTISGTCISYVK